MKNQKPRYQEGGEQEVMQAIAQMLQQMSPEDVVKQLMQNNMPQEQAVQIVQQVMQVMQEQQGPPEQTGMEQPSPTSEPTPEQMAYGGMSKLIKKQYGGSMDFDKTDSRSYANDNLAYFANALKKNNAMAFLKETATASVNGLPKAATGIEVNTRDEYIQEEKAKGETAEQAGKEWDDFRKPKTNTTQSYQPGTAGVWDGTKFVPVNMQNPYGYSPYMQPQYLPGYMTNPNPIAQLLRTFGPKRTITGEGLPEGFDKNAFLNSVIGPDGTLKEGATGKVGDKTYRVSAVTPFNERKGVLGLRRKRGVRFDIDWSDPAQVAEAINNPEVKADFTAPEVAGPENDPGQFYPTLDGKMPFSSSVPNTDVPNAWNEPWSPPVAPIVQETEEQKRLRETGDALEKKVNPANTSMYNYTNEGIKEAAANPNAPLTNEQQAMVNVLIGNKKVANDYSPEQINNIVQGMKAEPLGRYQYNTETGERELVGQYSLAELEEIQRKKLQDIDELAENVRKKQYEANPGMFKQGFSETPYIRPTNEFIDAPTVDEILESTVKKKDKRYNNFWYTANDGTMKSELENYEYNQAWQKQGVKNNAWGFPILPDGTKVVYDPQSKTFVPKKAYGGELPKAENGSFVNYEEQNMFNATPEEWANAGIYSADMLANFADKVRQFRANKEQEAVSRNTVNLMGSKSFSDMEQGLYDQWGNFKPNDLNNQVLNPTDVSYNRMMRVFEEGGEYDLSEEEIAAIEQAGYKIKRV